MDHPKLPHELVALLTRHAMLALPRVNNCNMGQLGLLAVGLMTATATLFVRHWLRRHSEHGRALALGAQQPKNLVVPKDPFFGLDYMVDTLKAGKSGRYLAFMWERFQKLGTTIVMRRWLYDTVSTIDPENLQAIMSTDFESWKIGDLRAAAFSPLFGDGIFASNGQQWAHARALIRPSFTKRNMQPLFRMMERHVQVLLRDVPTDGTTFDLQRLISLFTMDTATEFLMGHSVHALDKAASSDADAAFMRDYVDCCLDLVRRLQIGPLQVLFPFALHRKTVVKRDRAWAYIDKFVAQAMEAKRSGKLQDRDAFVDGNDGPEYNFLWEAAQNTDDPVVLRTQMLNILLASSDTTACLLSNFFWSLSRHPAVFAKLKKEVDHTLCGRLPTEADLKSMTYLRWCLNETLRLHPSVPANSRQAAVDTVLPVGGGADGRQPIFVAKGTVVLYFSFAMHRRRDIFGPDADEYRPERWDGLRPGWAFLPFNGGPRVCIGQNFALSEASYFIVRFLQNFDKIEARDDRPWAEFFTLALFSKHGVNVSVSRRA